ncbi:MAG: manganese efflux pump MntP family protein, partial [Clostridia bacterium]|nr:manganese efflux pump MntP family protein [Clostridia bacterium]
MGVIDLLFLAVGLSMDAFAVAICIGLAAPKTTVKGSVIVGLYFGVFQAVMPLIGYSIATLFADQIIAYGHWIALLLLCFLGGKMIIGSRQKENFPDRKSPDKSRDDQPWTNGVKPNDRGISVGPVKMLPLALATSIDALAVGVSFAFLQASILASVFAIGLTTLFIS